ncbi:MAG: methionine--tRNA ligase [Candidatus Altiarchaeota archaeon]
MAERILVTAALPYANGPIHIGHAIGCYVPADVYVRYHRMLGDDVIYICGTDEHGTPISVTAEQEGITPGEVVAKYHEMHLKAFEGIGVKFTNFSGTARPIHHKESQEFFRTLLDKGFIYKKTVLRPYCPNCRRFLPDRYVKGVCPKCESQDERGDQCEKCGTQLEPHELKKPYCVICRNTPEMRETDHWFFKLSELSENLRAWVDGNRHWPANARNFASGWIREGLQDRAITRDLSWGVPVPVDGAEGKVLYVWFDAPIGYISSTKEWAQGIGTPKKWEEYWLGGKTKIVHFIGKDNIPFHAIIWPAMLMAHGGFNLPWQIASNEYLNLEGRKMSTSRKWVLWLHDCLREFEPDLLRYYLLTITPQSSDSDFSLNDFQSRVNNELIATLGNLVNRVMMFMEKEGGQVPNPVGLDPEDQKLIEHIKTQPKKVGELIDRLDFINAQSQMMSLAQEGNKYFQGKQPWKNKGGNTLYLCGNLLRSLAITMAPLLPYSAEKIWKMLALEGSVHDQRWEDAIRLGLEGGHRIGKVQALYAKIEDEKLEEFKKKYLPHEAGEIKKEGTKMVDYEEFNKVDLRVGVVKEAKDHPNADNLMVLKVDMGDLGERTLVAGIKEKYQKDIVGRQIIVVANLKPAKIRGVESQGMLLAAVDDEGNPILLQPEKKAKPGARIK